MDNSRYPVPADITDDTHATDAEYQTLYQRSINEPNAFWTEFGNRFVTWQQPFSKACEGDFTQMDTRWFVDGKLNVCYNCVDRHLAERGDQTAILWEGDEPDQLQKISYKQLHQKVCRLANVLKAHGVKKGDRVCLYMPMIPEAVYAMLACARIGAIHSVVFGGFSPQALNQRILDADCKLVITSDTGIRGGKSIPLKANVDQAVATTQVKTVLVVKHTKAKINWEENRDVWYHEAMAQVDEHCEPEWLDSQDPLFILYTSGSTGKPKGICHASGGYLVYAAATFHYVFDYHDGDIYWCTADVGWITGHSYIVYGPLANGATTLMFEGVPNYPTPSRFWQVVDRHHVTQFYTAPTAIRALMREGNDWVNTTQRNSLKLLGTVGEPINPEVWTWYYDVVGQSRCPIVDTWWQTETGGIMLTPLPGATTLKPGSATRPFFGVQPAIVDDDGKVLEGEARGKLVMLSPWPGMMQTVYGDHQRFMDTYFKDFPGRYFTGDGARRDADGDYWITGRVDDVMNVSGHRLGTAEIESALLEHAAVAEAAVVGFPHDVKGEGIYAFVTLKVNVEPADDLAIALTAKVREVIGPIATPDHIQWAPALPKTRSGKIMRRILRKIAAHDTSDLGDTSTLADPSVVESLLQNQRPEAAA